MRSPRIKIKGFTLIELAVVISIVALLAAVAIPRLMNNQLAAQKSVALNFTNQLNSALDIYIATQGQNPPIGFTDFVLTTAIPAGDTTHTISTSTLGNGTCTVAAATVTCTSAFPALTTATYTWANGIITANVVAPAP